MLDDADDGDCFIVAASEADVESADTVAVAAVWDDVVAVIAMVEASAVETDVN